MCQPCKHDSALQWLRHFYVTYVFQCLVLRTELLHQSKSRALQHRAQMSLDLQHLLQLQHLLHAQQEIA
jgi:hypothetical protein